MQFASVGFFLLPTRHDPKMNIQKWEMLIRGHVQGVGFRYTAAQVARQQQIQGWVRNLTDGSVELQIQGPSEELERYMDLLEQAIHGNISGIEKVEATPDPALSGFEIRR